ncbi:MAG: hypothetical protein JXA41_04660 [Deltaproteobacteria bacterium]|nr:hypothetical protein [Deltaproteobacteria bacterium]
MEAVMRVLVRDDDLELGRIAYPLPVLAGKGADFALGHGRNRGNCGPRIPQHAFPEDLVSPDLQSVFVNATAPVSAFGVPGHRVAVVDHRDIVNGHGEPFGRGHPNILRDGL